MFGKVWKKITGVVSDALASGAPPGTGGTVTAGQANAEAPRKPVPPVVVAPAAVPVVAPVIDQPAQVIPAAQPQSQPLSRPVPVLNEQVLKYWHETLIADDVSGMGRADIQIALHDPTSLCWGTFNLGFGGRQKEALRRLLERAGQAGAGDNRKIDTPVNSPASGAGDNEDSDDEESEWEDEPAFIDDRLPMALVYHHTTRSTSATVWPEDNGTDQTKRSYSAPLDIVFWFPFEVDKDGKVSLPRDHMDRWPRVVRKWLDPQPAMERKDLPTPISYFSAYQGALSSFFAATTRGTPFPDYVTACLKVFDSLREAAVLDKYIPVKGHWVAVPRTLGYAVRALSEVYRAMPEQRKPSALEQVLGALGPSHPLDPDQPISSATSVRHMAMVDKGAKPDDPDKDRSADPLNDSQRRAVHALIELDHPGVIAVSGPPGTGKTAMLRAMIANQWVSAAYDGRQQCPVTLVCGATNQSVENVMGTFDGAVGNRHKLSKRWLKGTGKVRLGLTASMPSKKKQPDHKKRFAIMAVRRNGMLKLGGVGTSCTYLNASHLPAAALHWGREFEYALTSLGKQSEIFTDEQCVKAKSQIKHLYFVAQAVGQSDRQQPYKEMALNGVTQAVIAQAAAALAILASILQEGLRRAVDEQDKVRSALLAEPETAMERLFPEAGESSHWLKSLRQEFASAGSAEQRRTVVEKILDVECRPLAFHLAARYWEAQWLIGLASPETSREAELRRLAMLFPCMVSTLHSAPKLLSESRTPMFGFADLLIIDEAGQAAPELGAAVMSLACKAVVVGDMKQLAPVPSVTEELDARYIADRWGGDAVLEQWRKRGADAATGSIMKLAATGASRAERALDGTMRDGLLLREHYRCAESIINVCIDLLYHDHDRDADGGLKARELIPMKTDPAIGSLDDADLPILQDEAAEQALRKRMKASYPLPPLAFYQTGGPNDEPVKQDSWLNPGEVQAVVHWLKTTGLQLCKWLARADGRVDKPEDLSSVVAIVTPFRGQANAIRQAVKEHLDGDWGIVEGEALSERMTIGTVHTLQGAEKPVVLFSAVNKESPARKRTPDNHRERVFIDRDDGRLLNVAISRAQKSFILFGHSDLFFSPQALSADNDLPSAIVGRCLAGVNEREREVRTGAPRKPAVKLGPTRLMVVESPHKAKIIQSLLPHSVQVFGSGGHIRDLSGPGAIRFDDGLRPGWQLCERDGQSEVAQLLRRTASRLLQCEELILGTDNDAQGEAIAWHILDVIRTAPWFAHVKQVRRVRFQALTSEALQQAFNDAAVVSLSEGTPGERMLQACQALNMGVAYGALATRVLDNLIGSVYAWRRVPGGGRIKGPLLRVLAGEGDAADAPGGNYGLHIGLKIGDKLVPARLMTSCEKGPWKAWASSDREDAGRCLQQLGQARLSPVSCLVSEETRSMPSDEQLGTNMILREAYRRFGMLPTTTTEVLQTLYEHRPEEDADREAALTQPCMSQTAWAFIDDTGVLRLTATGQQLASTLLNDPWLEKISSSAFLSEFDHALSLLAHKPAATVGDYQSFVSEWAGRFADRRGIVVEDPSGPILDEAGEAYLLFQEMPEVSRPTWAPTSALPATHREVDSDVVQSAESEKAPQSDDAGSDSAARNGAHGALAPLDVRIGADSELFAQFSERQRQVYAMMRALTVASIVSDVEVRLARQVFPLQLPDGMNDAVELGVEVVTLDSVTHRGWSDVDPVGWDCESRQWGTAEVASLLAAGTANPELHVDPHIYTRSLPAPTVDRLLGWMEQRGLGRPSTFSTHVTNLLNDDAGNAQAAGATGLEAE
ncbi:AAA domain-containing protein [Massilia alkalitolerans]|uniref:AAA domain-containing protein n=1 Tax=Massilia alkalitolerans TaxID=286638 RepID=UPI00041F8684|nr:AAA domain-containing protein [Massilia alkalitolerans]